MLLRAVDGVNITLKEGQTIGIVGESGSGKSTLGRALLRLLPATGAISSEATDISDARPLPPCGRCDANCSWSSRTRSARCRRA